MPLKKKGQKKVAKVMGEFKRGTLHHGGSGDVVKRKDIALAIAMSQGRKADRPKKKRKKS